MSTPTVGSVVQTTNTASTPGIGRTASTRDLGQDAFLRLLTTQLQNQDPTKPQDNGEFIAQLATFSSLEKLTAISTKLDHIGSALGVTLIDPAGSKAGDTDKASSSSTPGARSTTTNGGK